MEILKILGLKAKLIKNYNLMKIDYRIWTLKKIKMIKRNMNWNKIRETKKIIIVFKFLIFKIVFMTRIRKSNTILDLA